jgi:sugar O-acyltransferase (sialic acid O-acetyltransferase NeuD family)
MKLLVYGSKEFGRVIKDLVGQTGHEFAGFVDDFSAGPDVVGTYEHVRTALPPASETGIVVAIGYDHLAARWSVYQRLKRDGYTMPALVHRTAIVHPDTRIGEGAIVMAGANVDVFSELGDLTVLWPGVIVSHDCNVGRNCFLSPGAVLCGFVTTGTDCFVGAGAVIADHRSVPDGTFVKAGVVYA